RAIKTHMGMDTLRCKTPEMVEKEIAVHFLAYTTIQKKENLGNVAELKSMVSAWDLPLIFLIIFVT
ncbi:MAG: hypothetical protein QM500_00845, partial [Methylococcales bacterium]